MKITREHKPADRYTYDFGLCSCREGWAQIDTDRDAHYFGLWAHPGKRLLFNYCEGDCTLTQCETQGEFVAEVTRLAEYYGAGFKGIDPGLSEDNSQAWRAVGLGHLLHGHTEGKPAIQAGDA
jgi:hypothetical protein